MRRFLFIFGLFLISLTAGASNFTQDNYNYGVNTQQLTNYICNRIRIESGLTQGVDYGEIYITNIGINSNSAAQYCNIYDYGLNSFSDSYTFSGTNCALNQNISDNMDYIICVYGSGTDAYNTGSPFFPVIASKGTFITETNCGPFSSEHILTDCGNTTTDAQSIRTFDLVFTTTSTTTTEPPTTTTTTSTSTTTTTTSTSTTLPDDIRSLTYYGKKSLCFKDVLNQISCLANNESYSYNISKDYYISLENPAIPVKTSSMSPVLDKLIPLALVLGFVFVVYTLVSVFLK